MAGEVKLEMPRILGKDSGSQIRGGSLIEIRQEWDDWRENRAWARRVRGERLEYAESRGASFELSELLLWFLARTEEDQEAILREGRKLLEPLRHRPYDGRRKAIERRCTRSVLVPDDLPPGPGGLARPRPVKTDTVVVEGAEDAARNQRPAGKDRRRRARH